MYILMDKYPFTILCHGTSKPYSGNMGTFRYFSRMSGPIRADKNHVLHLP